MHNDSHSIMYLLCVTKMTCSLCTVMGYCFSRATYQHMKLLCQNFTASHMLMASVTRWLSKVASITHCCPCPPAGHQGPSFPSFQLPSHSPISGPPPTQS